MSEIERKFLLRRLPPGIEQLPATRIRQGYLMQDDAREIRLRQAGDDFFLTVKDGAGLSRGEVEIPITREQFAALWPLTEGRRIEKTRAIIPHGAWRIEVDRYSGALAPLCVAEVEFASVAESEAFEPPDFFGEEITGRVEYRNARLAMRGLPA
jgi:CYTH domain-containing protein